MVHLVIHSLFGLTIAGIIIKEIIDDDFNYFKRHKILEIDFYIPYPL